MSFLTKRFDKTRDIIIYIFIIQCILVLANLYISYFLYADKQIIQPFDPEYNLFEAVIMPLIGVPLIWIGYLWQPNQMNKVLNSFIHNNLILADKENKFMEFIAEIEKKFNWKYTNASGLLLSFIFLSMFVFMVDPAQQGTKIHFWYYNKEYYYLFHLPTIFLFTIFPLLMSVIIFCLNFYFIKRIFSEFKIIIHLLHPDELGGLGQLGHMFKVCGLFLVILGIGMTIISSLGRESFSSIDVLTGYLLYVVLILMFIYTIFFVHNSMKQFRQQFIFEKLSESFDITLSNAEKKSLDSDELKNDVESLIKIKNQSDTLRGYYPLWPIRRKLRISLLIVNLTLMIKLIDSLGLREQIINFVSSFH